jgi:YgiT-type zinc finger domain-containing protein
MDGGFNSRVTLGAVGALWRLSIPERNFTQNKIAPSREGANLLVIENIPMVSCPHCGSSYFTAETLREIERIKLHRKNFARVRNVAVAAFAATGK